MPRVRNPVGREYVVPPGHWALTDPEFVILPDSVPERELAPAREPVAPVTRKARAQPKKG